MNFSNRSHSFIVSPSTLKEEVKKVIEDIEKEFGKAEEYLLSIKLHAENLSVKVTVYIVDGGCLEDLDADIINRLNLISLNELLQEQDLPIDPLKYQKQHTRIMIGDKVNILGMLKTGRVVGFNKESEPIIELYDQY